MSEPARRDDPPDPTPAPAPRPVLVRASDAEREQVADVVRRAVGDGRLSLAEGDERLAGVYASVYRGDLEVYTIDLEPVEPSTPTRPGAARVPAPDATGPASTLSFAMMSGTARRGSWSPGAAHTAVAVMGGVELDLRRARLEPGGTTIRAFAVMGGVEITVGPDTEVHCDGVGVMGGFSDDSGPPRSADGPAVRVTGLAFWGGVSIVRRALEGTHGTSGPALGGG